jgi:hypothetical protein
MMMTHRIVLKTHLLLTTHVRFVHSGHSREKFQKGGPLLQGLVSPQIENRSPAR